MSELTQEQLNRAALNLPADEFQLGERIFKIVDLPYDDYICYIDFIRPVIENVCKKMVLSRTGGVSLPGGINIDESSFSGFDFLGICRDQLPELAWITCKQTYPDITVEEVKQLAKKPQILAEIVLKQIVLNGMITDFKNFFQQGISILKALR